MHARAKLTGRSAVRCSSPRYTSAGTQSIVHSNPGGGRLESRPGTQDCVHHAEHRTLQGRRQPPMHYRYLLQSAEGPVGIITLNRPERRNALSLDLMQELIDCLDRFSSDRGIRAIILAAEGKVFSSG